MVVRAARRAFARALFARCGVCGAVGAGLGLAMVGASKLGWTPDVPAWLLIATPVGLGLGAGVVWAVLGRWTPAHAAAWLDSTLALKDRLTSAMELERRAGNDPFVALALQEAGGVARGVNVAAALPVRFDRAWALLAAGLGAAIAVSVWAPQRERIAGEGLSRAEERQRERAVEQVQAVVPPATDAEGPPVPSVERELDAVREIERELARGEGSAESARARAARALERASDASDREATRAGERADAVKSALARSARSATEGDAPGAGAGIAESLRRGDVESAAAAAGRLAERAGAMSPEARERAARELERLARDLDEIREREQAAREQSSLTRDYSPDEPAPDQSDADDPDAPATVPQSDAARPPAAKEQAAPDATPGETSKGETRRDPTSTPATDTTRSKPSPKEGPGPTTAPEPAKPDSAPSPEGSREQGSPTGEPKPDDQPSGSKQVKEEPSGEPWSSSRRDDAPKDLEKMARSMRDAARELASPKDRKESPAGTPPKDARHATGEKDAAPNKQEPTSSDTNRKVDGGNEADRPAAPKPKAEPGVRPTPSETGSPSDHAPPGAKQPAERREDETKAEPRAKDDASKSQKTEEQGESNDRDRSGTERSEKKEGAGEGQRDAAKDPGAQPPKPGGQSAPSGEKGARPTPEPRERAPGEHTQNPAGEQRDADGPGRPDQPRTGTQRETGADPSSPPAAPKAPGTPPGDGANQPKDDSPSPGESPSPNPGAVERLAKELHKLAESPQTVQNQRRVSREMREQARKMLENASPEDLRRIAEAMRNQPGGDNTPGSAPRGEGVAGAGDPNDRAGARREWDGKSELVDARDKDAAKAGEKSRVVSQWSGDPSNDPRAPATPGEASNRVRAAAAGAERAVEQQIVPSQYGPFVKRVFRKYVERAATQNAPPAATPTPAVPDAPDARPRGN